MWKYAVEGMYTDIIVKEDLEYLSDHTPLEYPAHRLILSNNCEYFRKQFESTFSDSNNSIISVVGYHQYPGLLQVILKAIYCTENIDEIYKEFVNENKDNLDKCIALFNVCSYLLLDSHMTALETHITTAFKCVDIVDWVNDPFTQNTYKPIFVMRYIREFLDSLELEPECKSLLYTIIKNETSRNIFMDFLH